MLMLIFHPHLWVKSQYFLLLALGAHKFRLPDVWSEEDEASARLRADTELCPELFNRQRINTVEPLP